jgi:hypothetical protein
MLALTTRTGRTYTVDLAPIPFVVAPPPQEHHAYVLALTNGTDEKAALLQFATVAHGESMGRNLTAWQRMGATHYGVVAERHPEREAEALAAELAQTFDVPLG